MYRFSIDQWTPLSMTLMVVLGTSRLSNGLGLDQRGVGFVTRHCRLFIFRSMTSSYAVGWELFQRYTLMHCQAN